MGNDSVHGTRRRREGKGAPGIVLSCIPLADADRAKKQVRLIKLTSKIKGCEKTRRGVASLLLVLRLRFYSRHAQIEIFREANIAEKYTVNVCNMFSKN